MSETKDCGCTDANCNCDITGVCVSWDSECNCTPPSVRDTSRKLRYVLDGPYLDSSVSFEDRKKEMEEFQAALIENRKLFESYLKDPSDFFELIEAEFPGKDDINRLGGVIKKLMARVEELERKE